MRAVGRAPPGDATERLKMPVGRPRSGRFSLRIPAWLHEELASEAYHRNVSLNQLCFEAIVARRVLVKKPPVQATLAKLDKKRVGNRKVIQAELSQTVTKLAADAPDRKPPREEHKPILEFVRKQGRAVTVADVSRELGIPPLEAASGLFMLCVDRWLQKLAGERYQLQHGGGALGLPGFG
jgi:predicted HicB family RNase H-like nuclease